MIYTVSEISDLTKLSKVSIYKRLKLKEFEPHIQKMQGVTYLTEEGLKLIKNDLKINIDGLNELNNKEIEQDPIAEDTRYTEDLTINKELINALLEQLKGKDKQIQELNNRLAAEQELHKNTQVLLGRQQEPRLLEEHFKELDLKLISIKEQMEQRKEHAAEQKKGLLKRLFKK